MKHEKGPRRRRPADENTTRNMLRSDGAHDAKEENGAARTYGDDLRDSPAAILPLGDPAMLEKFEELDDVVFEAIAGKLTAVERLRKLWPLALSSVGHSLAEESRQAYLQHALNKWHDCTENGSARSPKLAAALMDVLCVLLGDAVT